MDYGEFSRLWYIVLLMIIIAIDREQPRNYDKKTIIRK